jgi:hypothetical protein
MKSALVFICLLVAGFYIYKNFSQAIPLGDTDMRSSAGIREADLPGAFDPSPFMVKGLSTVIVLCSRDSQDCKNYKNNYIPQLLSYRPDLLVQFLYMSSGIIQNGTAMKNYGINIKTVPSVRVYSPRGLLIDADTPTTQAGKDLLTKAIDEAKKAPRQR